MKCMEHMHMRCWGWRSVQAAGEPILTAGLEAKKSDFYTAVAGLVCWLTTLAVVVQQNKAVHLLKHDIFSTQLQKLYYQVAYFHILSGLYCGEHFLRCGKLSNNIDSNWWLNNDSVSDIDWVEIFLIEI